MQSHLACMATQLEIHRRAARCLERQLHHAWHAWLQHGVRALDDLQQHAYPRVRVRCVRPCTPIKAHIFHHLDLTI